MSHSICNGSSNKKEDFTQNCVESRNVEYAQIHFHRLTNYQVKACVRGSASQSFVVINL